MKRKILLGILIALLIVIGIVWFINSKKPNEVIGYEIGTGSYEEFVSAIGYVEYQEESVVQVEVSGKVKTIYVDEGDLVSKGEVIALLDDTDALRVYEDLEGKLNLAKSRYEDYTTNYSVSSNNVQEQRQTKEVEIEGYKLSLEQINADIKKMQELFNEGIIAKSELEKLENEREKIENNIKVAQSALKATNNPAFASQELEVAMKVAAQNLDQQKEELKKYKVYSPYDSIVLESYVNEGDFVQPAQELIKIGSVNKKVVWVDVDERYIGKVQIGQEATLIAEAYPDQKYKGKIVGFSPSIDRETGTIGVKVEIVEGKDVFIRNMSVKVDVAAIQYDEVVLIPGEYIYDKEEMTVLMLNDEGDIIEHSISVENLNKEMIHVLDGLESGDIIIKPTDIAPGDSAEIKETITDVEKRVDD